jgi:hypothetical protein
MSKDISQIDIVLEYFMKNPNREISHPEVVDWVVIEFKKRIGKISLTDIVTILS